MNTIEILGSDMTAALVRDASRVAANPEHSTGVAVCKALFVQAKAAQRLARSDKAAAASLAANLRAIAELLHPNLGGQVIDRLRGI